MVITYFDSFGVEHIPKETKKFIDNKNNITNSICTIDFIESTERFKSLVFPI